MRKSGIIGLALVVTMTVLCILMGGSDSMFVNLPSLYVILIPTLGLGMMSYGTRAFLSALGSVMRILTDRIPKTTGPHDALILRRTITHLYATGTIGTLIGWIQMLVANCRDTEALMCGFAVSLLTVFYALLISELLLRPAANRIESQDDISDRTQNHGVHGSLASSAP